MNPTFTIEHDNRVAVFVGDLSVAADSAAASEMAAELFGMQTEPE